jgi:hypothetical protein
MTEHTPEQVADLIAELRKGDGNGCKHANDMMHRAADALEAMTFNRDVFRNAWNGYGFEIIRLEWERDEALAVIAEVRAMLPGPRTYAESLMRDFAGNPWPQTINADEVGRILSRIPEHPKED